MRTTVRSLNHHMKMRRKTNVSLCLPNRSNRLRKKCKELKLKLRTLMKLRKKLM